MKSSLLAIGGMVALLAACTEKPEPKNQDFARNGGSDGPFQTVAGEATDANDVYKLWCQHAAQAKSITEKLTPLLAKLCVQEKPTVLLAKGIPGIAYAGTGEPQVERIAESKLENGVIKASIALGIKLPINAKQYFDEVAPLEGDKASREQRGADQGVETTVEIRDSFTGEGPLHVRGWRIYAKSVKQSIIKITTESVIRSDHYKVEDGKAYIYTAYLEEGIKGIVTNNRLTAGVQVDQGSYLLTVADIAADSLGAPKNIAENEVMSTAQSLVKSIYQDAIKSQ